MTRHLIQKNNYVRSFVSLLTVAMLVFGCSNKEKPIAVVTAPTAVNPKQQEVRPVQKTLSTASVRLPPPPPGNQFDFSGKKDPFKPDASLKLVAVPSSENFKKTLQSGLPIHSFDVSQFRLIGIVTTAKENKAMVVDPNGKGYVLKVGMTIGKNDGRVKAINSSGVDVIEQFKDDNGRVRRENIRITLPRKQ